MSMFCYQCEQTSQSKGCTTVGICGKDSHAAALQDAIVYLAEGMAMYSHRAKALGATTSEYARLMVDALFTTITNVNFDNTDLENMVRNLNIQKTNARNLYLKTCAIKEVTPENLTGPATFEPSANTNELIKQAATFGIESRQQKHGADLAGLQELLMYGLKGVVAYSQHARVLGAESEDFYTFLEEALNYLGTDKPDANELLGLNLKSGAENFKIMELLSNAHTTRYGHPVPTNVLITAVKGKAILISGHDLHDLESLLVATQGKGINIYTHGEMLPAHGYPELKKYPHLVGNYGGAWQDQAKEFDAFPGAILMTTNCIQKPRETYKNRIFTTGLVGWPGVTHVANGKWTEVIDSAQKAPGFTSDEAAKTIMVGFGHNAVLSVAPQVIDAVKSGAIKKFVLIGGCDGAKTGRDYFTNLAESLPSNTVILTLACGKYRFNKHDFGTIGGIPRLLDIGQCNDAYSAVKIAVALADAFKTDVNSLPLSMVLSWYEQKAVAVLLSLLHLGIKNIRIGPSLPAFITPNVLNILVEKFAIKPIGTVEDDLKAIMG